MKFRKPSSKNFFRSVCPEQSYCFDFNETMFYAWWVAGDEVRKLEGLGRLVLGSDIQMESFANLSPLNTVASRKVIGFSDISAVNLIVQ